MVLLINLFRIIVADGCFAGSSIFLKAPDAKAKELEELFRYQVLKMLKAQGKITDLVIKDDGVIENMMGFLILL
jgi:hypothetical protein